MGKNTVILTHAGADLDALSSMYAAGKLYPGSFLVHPGSLDAEAKKMTDIFGDLLNLVKVREIPKNVRSNIERIIIVDTKIPSRIGEGKEFLKAPNAEIIVFDHHPPSARDIKNAKIISRNTGSNTTILVDLLKKKKEILSHFEATLLALGIYEDTGSFMFPSVSSMDFEAIAFLSTFGINMRIIRSFISPFLTKAQISLLKNLLSQTKEEEINGIKTAFARAKMKKYIQGISVVAHRLREVIDSDLLFVIVEGSEGTFVIGRSNSPSVDVKEIILPLGGGGHTTAATAIIKGKSVKEIENILRERIRISKVHGLTAKDVMSSPVKMIPAKTGIRDAYKLMVKMGYSGLPVTEKEKVIGIISKRDIEKIILIEKRNRPVKQYLSPNVVEIPENTPLKKIEEVMAENNTGRILVEKDKKITGIISRSDLLKALYMEKRFFPDEFSKNYNVSLPSAFEISQMIKSKVPKEVSSLFPLFGEIAEKTNQRIYLVGGAVRDLFLGAKTLDFDFVLTGDAILFGKILSEKIKRKVVLHEEFGTAHLSYRSYELDFVTARRESYEKDSLLPRVENATLKEDLSRRDFTINTMAVSLMPESYGRLTDLFNGLKDLKERKIRILHSLSFIEDPSRLLRAVKYEAKLGFSLSFETEHFFKKAIELGALKNKKSYRIIGEFKELLSSEYAEKAVLFMQKRGILKEFLGIKKLSPVKKKALAEAEREVVRCGADRFAVYATVLMYGKTKEEIAHLLSLLSVKRKTINRILLTLHILKRIKSGKVAVPKLAPEILKLPNDFVVAMLLLSIGTPFEEELRRFIENRSRLLPELKGEDLKAMGLKEGKEFGKILKEIIMLKAEGKIRTKEDEIKYVLDRIKEP